MEEKYNTNKIYIILCEGSSERAYIQLINRFFKENEININFVAKEIGTGHFYQVEKAYKENKNKEIIIWVDEDIYKRDDKSNGTSYLNKKQNIPDYIFTKYNFEDFLVMHLDDDVINKWHQVLNTKGHFNVPLKSNEYIPLIKENIALFQDYEKGDIPFEITFEKIKQAYNTNQKQNINFKCDILKYISKNLEF